MFDLILQINIKHGKTFIVKRIACSNRQMALYVTSAIMQIQRDSFEVIKNEDEAETINLYLSKDKKGMKITTTLDAYNATYVLANSLTNLIRTL